MELPLDQSKLEELTRQMKHRGEFAGSLTKFYRRQENPIGSVYTELVEDAVELLEVCSDEEVRAVLRGLKGGFSHFVPVDDYTRLPDLEQLAKYYVASEVHGAFSDYASAIENSSSESVVLEEYPELEGKFDDDGLLRLDDSFDVRDGGIFYKNHVLHYHQLLRRNFGSNPNFEFLNAVIRFRRDAATSTDVRIAIDHRRLMPREAYSQIVEKDMWYGPPFDEERIDDPTAVGLTVVVRDPEMQGQLDFLGPKLRRTEVLWKFRDEDRIKEFVLEELSHPERTFDQFVLNRFLHAERDIDEQEFTHLDGSVKVYLEDEYPDRFGRDCDLRTAPKGHDKPKLWRIDGSIPLGTWSELVSLFLKGNEMVVEYLDPDLYEERFAKFRE